MKSVMESISKGLRKICEMDILLVGDYPECYCDDGLYYVIASGVKTWVGAPSAPVFKIASTSNNLSVSIRTSTARGRTASGCGFDQWKYRIIYTGNIADIKDAQGAITKEYNNYIQKVADRMERNLKVINKE